MKRQARKGKSWQGLESQHRRPVPGFEPGGVSLQSRYLNAPAGQHPGTGQGQLTLAELTVVEVPWLPVDEPVSLQETME